MKKQSDRIYLVNAFHLFELIAGKLISKIFRGPWPALVISFLCIWSVLYIWHLQMITNFPDKCICCCYMQYLKWYKLTELKKVFFYFSSIVFYLHCPMLHPVTSTALGVTYVLLFRDQGTSTATVGSAALQQLHVWILLWSLSLLYQNMPTYTESNLSQILWSMSPWKWACRDNASDICYHKEPFQSY